MAEHFHFVRFLTGKLWEVRDFWRTMQVPRSLFFTVKAPDSGHVDGRVYTHSHMAIGRASRYEQAG